MRTLVLFVVLLVGLGLSATHAQESGPTPPSPGEAALVVYVINDLNGNGLVDVGERGLAGWNLNVAPGCTDIVMSAGPTDANGQAVSYPFDGSDLCVWIALPFGWIATNGDSRRMSIPSDSTAAVSFLVHRVGSQVERFHGQLVVDGLPALDGATVTATVGGQPCGVGQVHASDVESAYELYVLGAAERAGCAVDGYAVQIDVNGVVVQTPSFAAGSEVNLDLAVGPAPMVFYFAPREGTPVPYVGSVICGEAKLIVGGFIPENWHVIYVFPDALRKGCGAPGRLVTLKAGGLIVLQIPWRAGSINGGDVPPFTPIPDYTLPITGRRASDDRDTRLPMAVAAVGLVFLATALFLRRVLVRQL